MFRRVLDWLDDRAGVRHLTRRALDEPLPRKIGWAHVLGSGALFLFIVQAVTGILLAMNYNPSPDHAYWSIQYIMDEVTMGRVIRGLHYWGASLMFIVVVLHMLRVYIYAAYKPPRELTWMVGVLLLLLVVGFSFTGYLLPWDQKAYWATQVGTEMPGTTPVLGSHIKKIIRGGEELGARTLSRFFAVHVLVLPALMVLLVPLHLYLMRRKGETPPFTDEPDERVEKPLTFYPFQMFKDVVFGSVLLAILLFLTFTFGVPLEGIAEPTSTDYIPRPEWYFLPIFQMLKLQVGEFAVFGGPREWIGAVLVPTIALLVLLLLPLIDRNPSRLPRNRRKAIAAAFVVLLTTATLGVIAYVETPAQPEQVILSQVAYQGKLLFQQKGCAGCHALGNAKPRVGPSFVYEKSQRNARSKKWLVAFLKDPRSAFPSTLMPALPASADELDALAEFITFYQTIWHRPKPSQQKAPDEETPDVEVRPPGGEKEVPEPPELAEKENTEGKTPRVSKPTETQATSKPPGSAEEKPAEAKVKAPQVSGAAEGRKVFEQKCFGCHKLNGKGGLLTALSAPAFVDGTNEHDRDWLKRFIKNPAAAQPGARMPPLPLTDEELEAVVDFVMTVRVEK